MSKTRKLSSYDIEIDSGRLLDLIADKQSRHGPTEAEIVPEVSACWHILQTWPGHEAIAAAHLAARRFGIYLPHHTITWKDRFGKERSYMEKLFPGYLFVFVWDILHHRRRIENCPGVSKILYDANEPAIVPDSLINWIQVQEAITAPALRKRRRRKRKDAVDEGQPFAVTISCRDVLRGLRHLDGEGRSSILQNALGLAS